MKFPSSGIRPPGAPRSIRPPHQRQDPSEQSAPASRRGSWKEPVSPSGSAWASGPPSPPRRRHWILAAAAVVVIAVVVTGPAHRTHPAPPGATAPPACNPWAAAPATGPGPRGGAGAQWRQAWSHDLGLPTDDVSDEWRAALVGDCLVVNIDQGEAISTQTGYRLTADGPVQIWQASHDYLQLNTTNPSWGGHVVARDSLIDPITGHSEKAPWHEESSTWVISQHLVLACRDDDTTRSSSCQMWEHTSAGPVMRWSRDVSFGLSPLLHYGMSGDESTGSIMVENNLDLTRSIMSLADGSLHGSWPKRSDRDSRRVFVPASDGWLILNKDTGEAASVTGDGQEQTFTTQAPIPALLLAQGRAPSLAQLRSAYETGQADWAQVNLRCWELFDCTLNGSAIELPEAFFTWQGIDDGVYQAWAQMMDESQGVLIKDNDPTSEALVLDLSRGTAFNPTGARDAAAGDMVLLATPGLIIKLRASTLVAFAP